MFSVLFGTLPANIFHTMNMTPLTQMNWNPHMNSLKMVSAYALGMALGYTACLFTGIA